MVKLIGQLEDFGYPLGKKPSSDGPNPFADGPSALTRQAVNIPLRQLDLGGRLPRLPPERPNPQNLGPVPTSSKGFVNFHGTRMRQPYTPMWKARANGRQQRGQRDIYTGQLIPPNIPRVNVVG